MIIIIIMTITIPLLLITIIIIVVCPKINHRTSQKSITFAYWDIHVRTPDSEVKEI